MIYTAELNLCFLEVCANLDISELTLMRTRISLVVMSPMLACNLCTTYFLADKGPTALKEIYPGIDLLRFLWCVVQRSLIVKGSRIDQIKSLQLLKPVA